MTDFIDTLLPIARHVARNRVQNGDNYDDMVQEAMIAMWEKSEKEPGQAKEFYKQAAKWRVSNVAGETSPSFGAEGVQGHGRPKLSFVGDDFLHALAPTVELGSSYYGPAMYDAINTLAPRDREYVVRRFWGGEDAAAVNKALGMHHNRWYRIIQPALAAALADNEMVDA